MSVCVSIIIPFHNNVFYIEKALNSALNQTFNDFEVICIDLGSSDNSLEIIKYYAKKDSRVKILKSKYFDKSFAYNQAIYKSKGYYIAFLEPEDFYKDTFVEKLYTKANKNDLDIVMCKSSVFDETKQELEKNSFYYGVRFLDNFHKDIFNHNDIKEFICNIATSPFSKLYKKDFLIKNNIHFPVGLQFFEELFFYKTFILASKISFIKEALYTHLINKIDIVNNFDDKTYLNSEFHLDYYKKNLTIYRNTNFPQLYNQDNLMDIVSISKLIFNFFKESGNFNDYETLLINRLIHLLFQKFNLMNFDLRFMFYYKIKDFFNDYSLNNYDLTKIESYLEPKFINFKESNTYTEFLKLDSSKEFSVIMPFYNSEIFLNDAINSLLKQNFNFEYNVELILVDDGSTDNSYKIAKEYISKYPENIKYIKSNHFGVSHARNEGLKIASGKIITFLDSDDKLHHNALKEVYEFFKLHSSKIDVVSIPIRYFDGKHGKHVLNDKFSKNKVVNLCEDTQIVQSSVVSSFIKREALIKKSWDNDLIIEPIIFNENQIDLEDGIFINKILLKKGKIGLVNSTFYEYRIRRDNTAILDNSYKYKNHYDIIHYLNDLIMYSNKFYGNCPEFIFNFILYTFKRILHKQAIEIFNSDEIKELNSDIVKLLNNISNDIILNNVYLNSEDIDYIIKTKYNYLLDGNSNFNFNEFDYESLKSNFHIEDIFINSIEFKNNNFEIMCYFTPFLDANNLEFYLDKTIKVNKINIKENMYFKSTFNYSNYFKLIVPSINKKSSFDFKVNYKNKINNFNIKLSKNFFNFSRDILINISKSNISLEFYKPKYDVSIIIPVYNVSTYLEHCLDSVLSQSLKNIEVLCIDDGSTDDSLDILNHYMQKDKRVKVISKENEGQGPTRNLGIKKARGRYVGFVDGDDWIEKDMFKKLFDNAVLHDLDMNMSKINIYDEMTGEFDNSSWYYGLKWFKDFDKDVFNHHDTKEFTCNLSVTPVNKIYKRDFLLNKKIEFPRGLIFEDELFFYKSYLHAQKVSFVDEYLYNYRVNRENSTMDKRGDRNSDIVDIFELVMDVFIETNYYKSSKVYLYNRFIHLILKRFSESSYMYQEKFYYKIRNVFDKIGLNRTFINSYENNSLNNVSDYKLIQIFRELDYKLKPRFRKILKSKDYKDFLRLDSFKEFSVIMAIYNSEKYLEEAIESVINQNFGFENNIELILIDDGSSDGSKDICLKYKNLYPNNIIYMYQENAGQATARNNGMKIAKGKYFNFLDSDDKLNITAMDNVYQFFEKHFDEIDIVSIPIHFFERETGGHVLNYKYSLTRVVDLDKEPNMIQLAANSSFVKNQSIKNYTFHTDLIISEDAIFLNKILLEKRKLGVVRETGYFYRKHNDETSTIDSSINKKDYYIHRSEAFFKALIDYAKSKYGYVPKFIQFTVMYDLQWMFRIEDVSNVLNDSETEYLFNLLREILQDIDDSIIDSQGQIDNSLKLNIFALKYGNLHIDIFRNKIVRKLAGDKLIDKLNIHKFYIDYIDIKNNNFIILGSLKSFFLEDEIKIQAIKFNENDFINKIWVNYFNAHKSDFIKEDYLEKYKDYMLFDEIKSIHKDENVCYIYNYRDAYNKEISKYLNNHGEAFDATFVNYPYRDKKYLGKVLNPTLSFDFNIPLNNLNKPNIRLRASYQKYNYYLSLTLLKNVNLSHESNYTKKENYLIEFIDNEFKFSHYSYSKLIQLEKNNIKRLEHSDNIFLDEALDLRKEYISKYKKMKNKRICLFMDRIDSADDNAEHLFKYAIKQKDNFIKYFVLSRDSKDFKRLKKLGNVLEYGSHKHKLLYLFAEKIISSHPDNEILNPFWNKGEILYSGLFNSKKYFIQHGIILHNISSWLHKYDKNLELLVTSSKEEYDSIFKYPYNYDNSVVKLLGLPRFDNLISGKEKKQIILMPSWRNIFSYFTQKQFESSNYFKSFNSLINNQKLIKLIKNKGYEIIFRPHINIYKFIDSFDNDFVKIDFNSSYQDLFRESKLMITDYSSVAFDFAYMKKPVLYYHIDDEFHFDIEDSYFDYEKNGFGEISTNIENLIDLIEEYMDNDCLMKEKYRKRATNFYEFNDRNNCKRVYDAIFKEV